MPALVNTRSFAAASSLLVLLLVFSSVPAWAGKYSVEKEEKKTLEPSSDSAVVYILRPGAAGAVIYFWAFADEQLLAITRGRGYAVTQLAPGTYTIWIRAENVSAATLKVEAGKTYYVKETVLLGWGKARARVEMIDETEGKKWLAEIDKVSEPTEEGLEKAKEIAKEYLPLAREKAAKKDQGGDEDTQD